MTLPDLSTHGSLYLVLGAILLAGLIARRVPLMRVMLGVASWALIIGVLVLVAGQWKDFDPMFGRFASKMKLDGQEVVGEEVRIAMSRDGHFWARVRIGDAERRMLIDSGATITAVSEETARDAGLNPREGVVPVILKTANGAVRAKTATVPELRFGTIVARQLPVVVSPAFGDINVLGMNFLSRLKSWRVENDTLVLVPNHPQPPAPV
ncbi:MAG TPA: TIGR02281 family clan AA aspartic protease [Sphingomonadaceae bacterium]|nr:TIGR02281 family clan AA aspartic protease [Sphingomonadaceae bacterium]